MVTCALIVDDDPIFGEIAKSILGKHGFGEVQVRDNPRRALALLSEGWRPDLLVLDLSMPSLDGFEFIEELRAISYPGPISIVSSEMRELVDAAASVGKAHGLNIIDAVRKPLQSKHVAYWHKMMGA